MTCIIAYKDRGSVYMIADSCCSTSYTYTIRKDLKLFRLGKELVIGSAGSVRRRQLLMELKPEPNKGKNNFKYIRTVIVNAIRKRLEAGGYLGKKDEVEWGGNFILAYRGEIYVIETDFQVAISVLNYNAIGSGETYALGALSAMEGIKNLSVKTRLKKAMDATCEFNPFVKPPYHMLVLKPQK